MVGIDIVTKVSKGNDDDWLWATFEHREHSPIAADAHYINAVYGPHLFSQGFIACETLTETTHLYSARIERPTNTAPQPCWCVGRKDG